MSFVHAICWSPGPVSTYMYMYMYMEYCVQCCNGCETCVMPLNV